jgi:hypothetical protein
VEEEGGGVRSGPGAAKTILLFHTISEMNIICLKLIGFTCKPVTGKPVILNR